jgi:uncharacterized protein YjbI with pentapeptide repeats
MASGSGSCTYVLDPDTPATWDGDPGEACYVDNNVLDESGVWHCPHDATGDAARCIFHQPVADKEDVAVVEAFLDIVQPAGGDTAAAETPPQFLGARVGSFDLADHTTGPITAESPIDWSHATFQEDVDWTAVAVDVPSLRFHGSTFYSDAVFSDVTIEGDLLCRSCAFTGYTSFSDVEVFGVGMFNGGRFERTATFHDATIHDTTDFDTAQFDGMANLGGATFESKLTVKSTEFKSRVNLDNTHFKGPVKILQTNFTGGFSCEAATFADEMSFYAVNCNEAAEFKTTTFETEADFRETEFHAASTFDNAAFGGRASFEEVVFHDDAQFKSVEFDGFAAFTSEFEGAAVFDSSQFAAYTTFQETTIAGLAEFESVACDDIIRFHDTTFEAATTFDYAVFRDLADFENTSFETAATFDNATFKQTAQFNAASFNGEASFAAATWQDVEFHTAIFDSVATFDDGVFQDGGTFSEARFRDRASFRTVVAADELGFREVVFATGSDFTDSELPEAIFDDADVSNGTFAEAALEGAEFENADLSGTDLERTTLSGADLFQANLSGARLFGARMDGVVIDTETVFDEHGAYRCVYDPNSSYVYDADTTDSGAGRIRKAMGAYHGLEQLTRMNTMPDAQSKFFTRRQDMRRLQLRQDGQRLNYWFAAAQNAVFRHGESFSRVVGWSVGTIVAFALVFPLGGWFQSESTGAITYDAIAESPTLLWKTFYHSTLLFLTGSGPLNTIGTGGEILTTLEALIAPILLALLIFVLGRRAAR